MNTYSGVKNVDPLLIKVAVSFNATRWMTLKKVVLPAALPMIFAGLRLAAGTSLLLLVAAEMIAAHEGIGALILHYGDLMITDRLMAGWCLTCFCNGQKTAPYPGTDNLKLYTLFLRGRAELAAFFMV